MFDLTVNPANDSNRLSFRRLVLDKSSSGTSGRASTGSAESSNTSASSAGRAQTSSSSSSTAEPRVLRVDVQRIVSHTPRVTSDDSRADLYLEMADLANAPQPEELIGQRLDAWV